ncbi:MAG: hypothetical protein U9N41_08400, partial [Euryarchaeota archaeon]|nr:hypothetical protein [Euryarchaeota archaeon]
MTAESSPIQTTKPVSGELRTTRLTNISTAINMMLGRYPDELIQIVRGVNRDNLGICLDVAHANTTKTLDEFLNIRDKAEDMEII